MELTFVHNTSKSLHSALSFSSPIISSRQLTRLGLPGGLNSDQVFNKDVLRSDDSVFFQVYFSQKGKPFISVRNSYGKNSLVLDRELAYREGWISAFVMTEGDLFDVAEISFPQELTARKRSESFADNTIYFAGKLHLFDFTLADFEAVFFQQVTQQLSLLATSNQQQYQHAISVLKSNDPIAIQLEVLNPLVFKPMGVGPAGFELKVPVLVDSEYINL